MTLRGYLAIGTVLALLVSHAWVARQAFDSGVASVRVEVMAAQAQAQAALIRAADAVSMQALDVLKQQAALTVRAREAEDAARANPDPCRVPTADSLRRLETRWEQPPIP
jgi:uncharacterized membrane protein